MYVMKNIFFLFQLLINPDMVFFAGSSLQSKIMNFGCGNRKDPAHIGVDIADNANADYIVAPGSPLPFPDDTFDMIISRYVLEHVKDLDQLMGEIFRVLKPGGMFRFCAPHAFSMDMYDDPTHCRFYTLRTMNYFTGASDVHYTESHFNQSGIYLRLSLAYFRWRIIRYPMNILLGSIGFVAPNFGEQLLKMPFITGTLFFELKKSKFIG